MDFVSKVEAAIERAGFAHYGWAKLERPLTMDVYRDWLSKGHHGSMTYLSDHADLKESPQKLSPRAVSAIVIAKPYLPHPYPATENPQLRTALYAQGGDYHGHFKQELEQVAAALKMDFNSHEFLCFTDSAPILERDLAYRAGIGWVGKNTCVIHPQKGSLFFLGQILTSLPLSNEKAAIKDFCGTCTRCIDACPTQALEERRLNATKCISYWTIEARTAAPEALRKGIGDWFFGCDICQTVCPWNEKSHSRDLMRTLSKTHSQEANNEDLRWILSSSNNTLARHFKDSPISRARPRGLKRNALMVIGNLRLTDLRPEVERMLDDENLKDIAEWALAQLT